MKKAFAILACLVTLPLLAGQYSSNPSIEAATQYVYRLQTNLNQLQVPHKVTFAGSDKTAKGEDMVQLKIGEIMSMILTSNPKGVQGIIFIGSGDGSQTSGYYLAAGAVAAILSLYPHRATKRERGRLLKQLLNDRVTAGKTVKFRYHGYTITSTLSQYTGFMVTADRKGRK